MKAVYLTKEVLDIFDEMGYSQFFRKIIDGLHTSMSRSDVPSSQRITLGKESLTVGVLKEVLGDLVNEDDLEAFAFIFNEKANKQKSKINKDSKEMGFYKNQQIDQQQGPTLIKFTDDFWQMLDKIRPGDDIIWDLYSLDSNPEIKNAMGITEVDISDKEWCFDIKTGSKPGQIKVAQFIKYFFKEKFTQDQIYKFIQAYNKIIGKIGGKSEHVGDVITPREFKYEPTYFENILAMNDLFLAISTFSN